VPQVKYRDGEGNTWVGRGPRPQWLRDALANGKTLADFAV
jgi:DNA-binding protein H-NS